MALLSFGFCKHIIYAYFDISKPKCIQWKMSMRLSAPLALRADSSIDHAFSEPSESPSKLNF